MKKIILGLILFGFFFSGFLHPAYAIGLGEVESATGVDIIYSGNEQNLNINQVLSGAYEIKASAFACTPRTPNCEPDKYEIRFDRTINHIFGLGMVASANQVELEDFLDVDFSFGHCFTPTNKFTPGRNPIDFYEADICRMRTPMFVMPSENIIIAYLQPWAKKVRLSRDSQYGCPSGTTCIVLKKNETYLEGQTAPLVIIKGSNVVDMYAKYNQYLKQKGFFFKNPIYQAFGVAWETYEEFVNTATNTDLNSVVKHYSDNNIKLASLTIGSGYWGSVTYNGVTCPESCVGCGIPETGCPATDALEPSSTKFPAPGLSAYFSNLFNTTGIYPVIGMRHQIRKGISGFDNKTRVVNIIQNAPYSMPASTSILYGGNSDSLKSSANPTNSDCNNEFYILNLNDSTVKSTWVDVLRNSYGAFKGIKNDDMEINDQRAITPNCPMRTNLPDNYFSQMYPVYTQKYNNDFLINGRLDWFSVGTDTQTGQGWIGFSRLGGPIEYNGYDIKNQFDSAITQVTSGYPHTLLEPQPAKNPDKSIPSAKQKEFVRTLQIQTFWPVMNQSLGFWHLSDQNYINAVVSFSKLKQRLQQYTYDQAQKWYETGIPYTVQPLFINYPNDETAYSLYKYAANDRQTPWDEYMFGNALLVRPIFSDDDTFRVYLPGETTTLWRYFLAGGKPAEHGGQSITYSGTINDYPVFLKEGEILTIADSSDLNKLNVYVFLENKTQSEIYSLFPQSGGKIQLQALKTDTGVIIKNLDNGQSVTTQDDAFGKGFKTADITQLITQEIPGDLNNDKSVNIFDLRHFLTNFLQTFNIFDYNKIVENFGK